MDAADLVLDDCVLFSFFFDRGEIIESVMSTTKTNQMLAKLSHSQKYLK